MAKKQMNFRKQPAAKPSDMEDDQEGAEGGAGGGDDEEDDEEGEGGDGQPTVLLTVMDNHDGTYTLIHGDEPEDHEEDEEEEGAEGEEEEGAEGEAPEGEEGEANEPEEGEEEGEGEEGSEEEEPDQEHFDSPGALMKGILDILNEAEADNGAGEHAFEEGFNETKEPTPKQ